MIKGTHYSINHLIWLFESFSWLERSPFCR